MSICIIPFNPGESTSMGPTGGFVKYTTFGTSLSDNPVSFFVAPQSGKITYFSFTYIPDATGDILVQNDVSNEGFIATVKVGRYDFTSGCHSNLTGTNLIIDAFDNPSCPFTGTPGLYFQQANPPLPIPNSIPPYILLNQNDLVTIKVEYIDFLQGTPTREISGKFGATLNYFANCYH